MHQFPGRFSDKFPYKLSLGQDENKAPLLPFRSASMSGDQIVVTESYVHMLHRILRLRSLDKGSNRGVVVTGQPGTGASIMIRSSVVRKLTGASILQGKLPSSSSRSHG